MADSFSLFPIRLCLALPCIAWQGWHHRTKSREVRLRAKLITGRGLPISVEWLVADRQGK